MKDNIVKKFIEHIKAAIKDNNFVKIKINKSIEKIEINKVSIRLVKIKNTTNFQFVYSYLKKDITKNLLIDEGIEKIQEILGKDYKNSILFTTEKDIRLWFNKKMEAKIQYLKPSFLSTFPKNHNRIKNKLVKIENNKYLQELGIATKDDQIVKNMQAKYKQINKFIEILDNILANQTSKQINVIDMGSGKGYLTFALYDYLINKLKFNSKVIGIELRKELVDYCNSIAEKCEFKDLKFIQSTIKDYKLNNIDILIALHACNTATDDAIYKGIISNCSTIILSPCCHQQIRPELNLTNELKDIGKHGILKERLAEMVTDTMRSLFLEAYGYKTQIFEFISDEHTHKNLMIVAEKRTGNQDSEKYLKKIQKMKKLFGINNFYLENILDEKKK